MEPIEDRIVALQTRNFESAAFIPADELEKLLTENLVRRLLKASLVEAWEQEEVVRIVILGARRIFAILLQQRKVHLMLEFIRNDQFQANNLDARLPLPEPLLESLLGLAAGRSFYTNQWMFIAPVFRYDLSHRRLDDPVVLPFIDSSKPIGEGAFGVVTKVTLHNQHQQIQATSHNIPVSRSSRTFKKLH
jgi:hypothetical protein